MMFLNRFLKPTTLAASLFTAHFCMALGIPKNKSTLNVQCFSEPDSDSKTRDEINYTGSKGFLQYLTHTYDGAISSSIYKDAFDHEDEEKIQIISIRGHSKSVLEIFKNESQTYNAVFTSLSKDKLNYKMSFDCKISRK